MNTTKDEYASHMTDIGETTLDFLSKSGMSGWPTILGILNIMVISPDTFQWLAKSGIEKLPVPEIGDDVHWYKTKFDLKSNLRRSVPVSLLKGVNMFTTNNIPESINAANKICVSKTSVYCVSDTVTKVCLKTELDPNGFKELNVINVLDVISKNNFDYILTSTCIYRLNNVSLENPDIIFENHGVLSAFCLANDSIIVAGSEGGFKINNISDSTVGIIKIERKTGSYTPPQTTDPTQQQGSQTSTTITYDNGVPEGACKYCWFDGLKYYIGDYTSCGRFDPLSDVFVTTYEESKNNSPFITSGTNKHHNGIGYVNKDGLLLYGSIQYSISDVKSVLELDSMIIFGTGSGLKVYSKSIVDGKYGPTTEYLSLGGINEPVTNMCVLYDTIFVIGKNKKYRSFDSEENDNKLRIIVFGTDYDVDTEANFTDAKEVKVNLLDLLNLGGTNSSVYDSKFAKANSKKSEYIIAIYDGKPKCFNLYGHDNRNAKAVELKACLTSFDMEV